MTYLLQRTGIVVFLLNIQYISTFSEAFAVISKRNSYIAASTTRLLMNTRARTNKKAKTKRRVNNGGRGFGGGDSGFPYSGSVRPGVISPPRLITDDFAAALKITKPDYADDGVPKKTGGILPWVVEVKTEGEIEKMRASGALARRVLDMAGRMVQPGVTTDEIDAAVYKMMIKNGAYPSTLNYHRYPKACCTSVNEVICHGIPDDRPLQDGDIINIDVTVYLNGFHGDCSEMFVCGTPSDADRALIQTTYDSWIKACEFVKPGNEFKDIGAIIEDHVVERGFSTVKDFCGHGIGSVFHLKPDVLHYRNNVPSGTMRIGNTFTIEPMICAGSARVLSWPDQWTATTVDGKRSAQFEHTLLVTEDGVEALTGKSVGSMLHFWERDSMIHTAGIWLGTSASARAKAEEINSKLALEATDA